ncbi:peroxidase, partial [Francisella tularensis subsp. holarctica]|nr:peroxidase [Francisella tularensis subsp. holarctica]
TASQSATAECLGRSVAASPHCESVPEFAHVKRSAKENFNPEAQMLRKSMPWSDGQLNGGFVLSGFAPSLRSFNLPLGK